MIVIPAIDIIDGACVRLTKGKFNTRKKYSDDPVEIAKKWLADGAEWLHVVDLDGARTGKLKNLRIVSEIKNKMNIQIQYGGGIRDIDSVRNVLKEGADRVILGTGAIEDINFLRKSVLEYKDRIILSLDYGKDGIIFVNGWQIQSGINIFDIIKNLESSGMRQVIVTDISRDGTLEGINFSFLKRILKCSDLKFIVAGGIGSLNDVARIKEIENMGIIGVIIGKALYERETKVDLKQAIRIGRGNDN
jgi:phosphoribosylformimino-5-aminoimidazole carboxamide ribotide isomerase